MKPAMLNSKNCFTVVMALILVLLLFAATVWRRNLTFLTTDVLISTIAIATVEEFIFRNGLQRFLMSRYSIRIAAFLTAVAFSIAHLPQYGVSLHILILGFDALTASVVYCATRSVIFCATIHALWNLVNRGNKEASSYDSCLFSIFELSCSETNGLLLLLGWALSVAILLSFFVARGKLSEDH